MEIVDRRTPEQQQADQALFASLASARLLPLPGGGWAVHATRAATLTASGVRTAAEVEWTVGPDGTLPADAVHALLPGALSAAAGEPDDPNSEVVYAEQSGEFAMRITRARLRGATCVSMPALAGARIVLDAPDQAAAAVAASCDPGTGDRLDHVVTSVSGSPVPVTASRVAAALEISTEQARGYLTRAVRAGRLVRLAPSLYAGTSTLPEGAAAASAAGLEGMSELEASAWEALRDLPPLPAAWFAEPTGEELPPGSGGVHYANGRIYGWVAQRGVPHEAFPGRNLTIESLGDIDTSAFLRTRFRLDDGSLVRVGAFTMNVGHHRDGAECETASCQFDDTRTVAGIVTVGMSKGGMWFSGAASPWLSDWDLAVFAACQPSYHMRQEPNGRWSLRAVLSVPVPGHPSKLAASAVIDRSNLALAASAQARADARAQEEQAPASAAPALPEGLDVSALAAALVPAVVAELRRQEEARAEVARLAEQLAPARAEVVAALAAQVKGGN